MNASFKYFVRIKFLLFLSLSANFAFCQNLFDTSQKYKNAKGEYIESRQSLHRMIESEILENSHSAVSDKPHLIFTAGIYGAGKSEVVAGLHYNGIVDINSFLYLDPDRIKEMIPEYEKFKQINSESAATLVHMESGDIMEKILFTLLTRKINILVDGSLRHKDYSASLINLSRKLSPQRDISIVYVDTSVEEAIQRANSRAGRTGRHVPEEQIRTIYQDVRDSVAALKSLADTTIAIDNNEQAVIKFAYVERGKRTLKIDAPLSHLDQPLQLKSMFSRRLDEVHVRSWRQNLLNFFISTPFNFKRVDVAIDALADQDAEHPLLISALDVLSKSSSRFTGSEFMTKNLVNTLKKIAIESNSQDAKLKAISILAKFGTSTAKIALMHITTFSSDKEAKSRAQQAFDNFNYIGPEYCSDIRGIVATNQPITTIP
jgi:predicted ABC-type ATPase